MNWIDSKSTYLQLLVLPKIDGCGCWLLLVQYKCKFSCKGYSDSIEAVVGNEVQELLELVGPQSMQNLDVSFIPKPIAPCISRAWSLHICETYWSKSGEKCLFLETWRVLWSTQKGSMQFNMSRELWCGVLLPFWGFISQLQFTIFSGVFDPNNSEIHLDSSQTAVLLNSY